MVGKRKEGDRPACAACHYTRHRCTSDCPLAQFFPADQLPIFQNVHRLYGIRNVIKILNKLNDDRQKQEAVNTIKYESYIRQMNRVHGCYGIIIHLSRQLQELMNDVQEVLRLLDAYRRNNEVAEDPSILPSASINPGNIDDEISNYLNIDESSDWMEGLPFYDNLK